MKTRAILPFLALSLLPLLSMAQNWVPVKMNESRNYLHKHKLLRWPEAVVGLTDTIGYGLMVLKVNEKSSTGQYRSTETWGVQTYSSYTTGYPGPYSTFSYVAGANFWFRRLDSLAPKLWLVHTLEADSVVFSMQYPARGNATMTIGRRRLTVHYPTRKIDTTINGVQDSALVYDLQADQWSAIGKSRMVLSKNNGLLQWRAVQLWTPALRPITSRKFNSDFWTMFRGGTQLKYLDLVKPMFWWEDSTIMTRTVNSNRLILGSRLIDFTDSSLRKYQFSNTGYTLSGGSFRQQLQIMIGLPDGSIPRPDTLEIDSVQSRLGPALMGNVLYRTVLPVDTNKPWLLVHIGTPMRYSLPANDDNFGLPFHENPREIYMVEGLGPVLESSSSQFGTVGSRILMCVNWGDSTSGVCRTFSLINNLDDAEAKVCLVTKKVD